MKISIKPSDLITRFIWDKYVYFCLDGMSSADVAALVVADTEFEITENHAFVIGLTNVIYTPEVVYKFKQYLKDILENKCFEQDNRRYINKDILTDSIADFKRKIPKNWKSDDPEFNINLNRLEPLYDTFNKLINLLATINVQECMCVKYGSVKKVINKL